jgi:outer membrane protein W
VDIAVTKNGLPNLDVKKIWIDTAATSCGIKVTQSGPYPAAWILGNGVF